MIKNAPDSTAPELEVFILRGSESTGIGHGTLGVELPVLANNELPPLSIHEAQEATPTEQEAQAAMRCTRVAYLGSLAVCPRAGASGNRLGGGINRHGVDESCSCRGQGPHGEREHENNCSANSSNLTALPFPSLV